MNKHKNFLIEFDYNTAEDESICFVPGINSSDTENHGENSFAYSVLSNMKVKQTLNFDWKYSEYIESVILQINTDLNYEYEYKRQDDKMVVKRLN